MVAFDIYNRKSYTKKKFRPSGDAVLKLIDQANVPNDMIHKLHLTEKKIFVTGSIRENKTTRLIISQKIHLKQIEMKRTNFWQMRKFC